MSSVRAPHRGASAHREAFRAVSRRSPAGDRHDRVEVPDGFVADASARECGSWKGRCTRLRNRVVDGAGGAGLHRSARSGDAGGDLERGGRGRLHDRAPERRRGHEEGPPAGEPARRASGRSRCGPTAKTHPAAGSRCHPSCSVLDSRSSGRRTRDSSTSRSSRTPSGPPAARRRRTAAGFRAGRAEQPRQRRPGYSAGTVPGHGGGLAHPLVRHLPPRAADRVAGRCRTSRWSVPRQPATARSRSRGAVRPRSPRRANSRPPPPCPPGTGARRACGTIVCAAELSLLNAISGDR
ncbi:hypothetical protein FHS37_005371 [Streptomyces griseostramineus]|uniref:Uncharacterized protein n=1 Tax=Streptomyces griseomycini TaxID=66895 RepID=A0A7W7PU16_9ACTN|nr:hypothetical protein [Streptomyces griseomycini]